MPVDPAQRAAVDAREGDGGGSAAEVVEDVAEAEARAEPAD